MRLVVGAFRVEFVERCRNLSKISWLIKYFGIAGFASQSYAALHNFRGEGSKGPAIHCPTTFPDSAACSS
jgi:hypothetical protein